MADQGTSIVWFRHDLRVSDHAPLAAAAARGGAVVPIFIWDPASEGDWPPGAASRWWLHQSLKALDASLRKLGSHLTIRCGDSATVLRDAARSLGAKSVFWSRRYEPAARALERKVEGELTRAGVHAEGLPGALLFDPFATLNKQGGPYQVFTPYWKACLALADPAPPLPSPARLRAPAEWPESATLDSLGLEPTIDWAAGLAEAWRPGEAGARAELDRFMESALIEYPTARDFMARAGGSRLSPHLHFGEISPGQAWHAVAAAARASRDGRVRESASAFLRQLGWRDFAHHLLVHFPHTPAEPLRAEFKRFPWREDGRALRRWRRGETGYPIVDAGMRELWRTGWMHNRARMIVASFLVKDLLISWKEGAAWFWDTLVDADLANNTLGWQWAGGCGADAAPYFRIFNPATQAAKFDPEGEYTKRWVPESCEAWGERSYPKPIVVHAAARGRALAALAEMKRRGAKN